MNSGVGQSCACMDPNFRPTPVPVAFHRLTDGTINSRPRHHLARKHFPKCDLQVTSIHPSSLPFTSPWPHLLPKMAFLQLGWKFHLSSYPHPLQLQAQTHSFLSYPQISQTTSHAFAPTHKYLPTTCQILVYTGSFFSFSKQRKPARWTLPTSPYRCKKGHVRISGESGRF